MATTSNKTIVWEGERWYGDPKWRSNRNLEGHWSTVPNTLKVKRLGFTLEGSVSRPGFARNAKLYVRLSPSDKQYARKVVLVKEFETSKMAKRMLKTLWIDMQNNSEPEHIALDNFLAALASLPDPLVPPTPPGSSSPGYGYKSPIRTMAREVPPHLYRVDPTLDDLSGEWWK